MSDSLVQLGIQILRITFPVIIVVGIVGNAFNLLVLTRRTLYRHACSRYFLALAINNLLYSSFISGYRLLASGYQLNLSNLSLIACKLTTYISTLVAFLSPYLIVCASLDRYCASSASPAIRRFSSVRTAKRLIFAVLAFFSLLFINIIVIVDLKGETTMKCLLQANSTYSQVYIVIQVFLFAIVPPSLMIIVGLMTIHNSSRPRVAPIAASRFYRTERQLARMLFVQVGTHIILTLPASVTYLISVLPNTVKTTILFSFISTIGQIFFNCAYTTAFFLYLLSGRIYRRELIRLTVKR